MNNDNKNITTKRIFIYLGIVLGFYFACWLLAVTLPDGIGHAVYKFLAFPVIFMGTPALATFLTRKITKDSSPWNLDLKVWKNWKALLFSAILPAAAIFVGAIIFYLVFPGDLDFNGTYLIQNFAQYGVPAELNLSIGSMLLMGFVIVLISAVFVPYWFLGLGEEIGWQGYLLPQLCQKMSTRKAVLLNSILWGIGHAPLIYFGFNYGLDYNGAPFAGILMMIVLCIVLGVWESHITLKTGNCMYAAIIHGSVNVIGETAVLVSLGTQSPLLGPNPTGIIGMTGLIIGAILLFCSMKKIDV